MSPGTNYSSDDWNLKNARFTEKSRSSPAMKKKICKDKCIKVGKVVTCGDKCPGLWNVMLALPILFGDESNKRNDNSFENKVAKIVSKRMTFGRCV
jgi:hypothetical protein